MLPRGHKRPRTASGDATDAGGEKRNTSASSSQAQNTDHSTPPSASQPYGSLDGTAGHQDIEGDSMPIENPFPHLDGVDEGPSLGAATMPLTHDGDLDDLALALPLVLLLALPVALVFAPILRATTANVPTSPNTPRTAATVQMRADAGTGAVLTYVPMEVDGDTDTISLQPVNSPASDNEIEQQVVPTSSGTSGNQANTVLHRDNVGGSTSEGGATSGQATPNTFIDYRFHPHIFQKILRYASNKVLGTFRGTSKECKAIVEIILYRHVALVGGQGRIPWGSNPLAFVDPVMKTRISGLHSTLDFEGMLRVLRRVQASTRVIDHLCPDETSNWIMSVDNQHISFDVGRFRLRLPSYFLVSPFDYPRSGLPTICRFQQTVCRLDIALSDMKAQCSFFSELADIVYNYFRCFSCPEITFVVNPEGVGPSITQSSLSQVAGVSVYRGFNPAIERLARYLYWCGARTFTLVGLEALYPVAVVYPEVPQPDIPSMISEALDDAYRNRIQHRHGRGTLAIDIVSKMEYEQRFPSEHERSLMLGEGLPLTRLYRRR